MTRGIKVFPQGHHTHCARAHAESTFLLILCQGLTDHEIITQMTTLLTASHEAITLILMMCAYCLARNPESMTHLQEEIDSTFPDQVRLQPVSRSQVISE